MITGWHAGRFVLEYGSGNDWGYVTSWDTWEEAEGAWHLVDGRIPPGYRLTDQETGRVWYPGAPYEWEAALT